jgi:hypothetical protein
VSGGPGFPYATVYTIPESSLLGPQDGQPWIVQFQVVERKDGMATDGIPVSSPVRGTAGVNEVIFN